MGLLNSLGWLVQPEENPRDGCKSNLYLVIPIVSSNFVVTSTPFSSTHFCTLNILVRMPVILRFIKTSAECVLGHVQSGLKCELPRVDLGLSLMVGGQETAWIKLVWIKIIINHMLYHDILNYSWSLWNLVFLVNTFVDVFFHCTMRKTWTSANSVPTKWACNDTYLKVQLEQTIYIVGFWTSGCDIMRRMNDRTAAGQLGGHWHHIKAIWWASSINWVSWLTFLL